MNQDWKTEFATGRPDRIPAGVIDSDECSIGVAIDQPQVFKDFQATGPLLFCGSQLLGHANSEIGLLTIPRRGIGRFPFPLPVDIGKDDEAVAVSGPEILAVSLQLLTQPPIQRDPHRNILGVHQFHKFIKSFG